MCGRFTLTVNPAELLAMFGLSTAEEFAPRFNIAPGQNLLTVVNDGANKALRARWGLVPHWAKKADIGYKLINARAETLAEKPAFRGLLQTNRCLIPADGFYEWQQAGKQKIPHRFCLRDRGVFAFAGLWSSWIAPTGEMVNSCAIITTEPNERVAPIHDRMPVMLSPAQCPLWLEPGAPVRELLRPFPPEGMEGYPVSTVVNSIKADRPDMIEPAGQGVLF
ncbi:SOS response-associated peptidase [Heliobacterium gestii]|uniref:Abasic site processing protein n=1 Tax=Heliomicrobium gestii TaxID=2699 RepID=A0A845LD92_HELGE|nr:SOS response-associated peptidase [Heliomicrobium gestii]MBM7866311.1 putative SOS response-associated peptidase YedK [Heliomicrobium gestii]MZP42900.1 SOS response-associated peptidase [Heliomicrobium gestii]